MFWPCIMPYRTTAAYMRSAVQKHAQIEDVHFTRNSEVSSDGDLAHSLCISCLSDRRQT